MDAPMLAAECGWDDLALGGDPTGCASFPRARSSRDDLALGKDGVLKNDSVRNAR